MSIRTFMRRIVPRRALVSLRLQKIFFGDYGHLRRIDGMPVDGDGAFQPWLTYPLLDYFAGFDFSQKDVFEFGAGASTLYWAARAKSVVSVEFDRGWYDALKDRVPDNASLFYEADGHVYADYARRFAPRRFDVIVIDGAERFRSAQCALDVLAAGGMIVLDNAEWYPRTSDCLAKAGLIEVRFSGFSPVNAFTSTSSVFLGRDFSFPLRDAARLPPRGGTALEGGARDDRFD